MPVTGVWGLNFCAALYIRRCIAGHGTKAGCVHGAGRVHGGWPCAWGLAVHSWPCGGLLIYDDEVELASVEVGLDDLDADRIAERVCDVMTLSDELECLLVEEVVVRL